MPDSVRVKLSRLFAGEKLLSSERLLFICCELCGLLAKPLTIDPGTAVSDAIDIMLEQKIGALIVADTLNQLKGIVSYEDILRSVRDEYEARV